MNLKILLCLYNYFVEKKNSDKTYHNFVEAQLQKPFFIYYGSGPIMA